MEETVDGSNPIWDPDGLPRLIWDTMQDVPMDAPAVARLRLALDSLHDAEALAVLAAAGDLSGSETVAAYREVRQARAAAAAMVAALTGTPAHTGKGTAGTWGGRREGAGAKPKNRNATGHRPTTVAAEGNGLSDEEEW